ncbi:MAG: lipase maturation factor family protein [Candidatus Magasanikbacteria bacterium]
MESIFSETYWIAGLMIQRSLGLVYLIAFAVALNQFRPLVGENGLLPIRNFLKTSRFRGSPSIFHFYYSDTFFGIISWIGIFLSALAFLGFSELGSLWFSMFVWFSLWVLYLSIVNVGQVFYSFGWESLLLEAGFFAIFIGPASMAVPVVTIYIFRWVLFRVEFGAGLIKIRGDKCWRDLTCLNYHHKTQPMPNPLSRFFHNLDERFHKLETLFNHFVQLIVPFGLFFPQPVAAISALLIICSQGWLMLSGNYAWLNFITIILAFSGISDGVFESLFSFNLVASSAIPSGFEVTLIILAILVAWLSIKPVKNIFSRGQLMNFSFNPFHLVNTYGAFGSVTKKRMEIVVKGTKEKNLGSLTEWKEYTFKGKPTDPSKRPPQFAPYHLRLDWQMWFAALSGFRTPLWFRRFAEKLLENNKKMLSLIDHNPFKEEGPSYIKADLYIYEFTDTDEYEKTGNIWKRRLVGEYLSPTNKDKNI